MRRPLLPRHAATQAVLGMLCVIGGSISVQYSVAIVTELFATVGTYGVNGLRMMFAGVVLFAIVRPRLRGRTKQAWRYILAFGLAMATMNVLFYLTVERLPLGVAVTLEHFGPVRCRRRRCHQALGVDLSRDRAGRGHPDQQPGW